MEGNRPRSQSYPVPIPNSRALFSPRFRKGQRLSLFGAEHGISGILE